MTVVRKFYSNAFESLDSSTTVRERKVKCDAATINAFFKVQNAPHGLDQVALIDDTMDWIRLPRPCVIRWSHGPWFEAPGMHFSLRNCGLT